MVRCRARVKGRCWVSQVVNKAFLSPQKKKDRSTTWIIHSPSVESIDYLRAKRRCRRDSILVADTHYSKPSIICWKHHKLQPWRPRRRRLCQAAAPLFCDDNPRNQITSQLCPPGLQFTALMQCGHPHRPMTPTTKCLYRHHLTVWCNLLLLNHWQPKSESEIPSMCESEQHPTEALGEL